jgi:hypothetical protein
MALAKLSILVSATDDPCGVDSRTWYITIYNCDGTVLDWCSRRYVVMRAPCGYLEVDVPPGTYYIKAVWGYTTIKPGLIYRVNHFTDAAIVTTCCESTTCVKLFNPSVHRCGYIYVKALQDMAARQDLDREVVAQAEKVVEAVRERGDFPGGLFEVGHEEEIAELVRRQEEEGG